MTSYIVDVMLWLAAIHLLSTVKHWAKTKTLSYKKTLCQCSLGSFLSVLTGYMLILLIRECAVKFNDYFEFPRDIDMEPFTELGLAKIQGEVPLNVMAVFISHFIN